MTPFLPALGWYWLVVPLIVALFGVLLLFVGMSHLFTGEPGRGSRRVMLGLPVLAFGLAASLLALNTQTFARLTAEGDVAEVGVRSLDASQGTYAVTVRRLDGSNLVTQCTLQGDEWIIGGRVQKWKPWANVLGLDSTYTLDQIDNKYFTAERGNGKMITACDLNGPKPTVNGVVPNSLTAWLLDQSFTQQRRFGSASYMPLADGAVYKVVMTQSGLNAEPTNDAARAANNAR
ncbi:MAG TPA: hypothetical protein VHL34_13845 [Rhizomicrobium sp.]|nr:hypothetical protein [Rhizomicrobium sp.]